MAGACGGGGRGGEASCSGQPPALLGLLLFSWFLSEKLIKRRWWITLGPGSSLQWTKSGRHFIGTFLGMRCSPLRPTWPRGKLLGLFPGWKELHTCLFYFCLFIYLFEARIAITIVRTWRIKIIGDKIYFHRRVENICEHLCGGVVETVEII